MPSHVEYSSLPAVDLKSSPRISVASLPPIPDQIEIQPHPSPADRSTLQYEPSPPDRQKFTLKAIFPVLKSTSLLLLGGMLALVHHFFNSHANGKLVDSAYPISQVWVNRLGNGFANGFSIALAASLSFVLCQLMWLTLKRKFRTFSEIDFVYRVAAKDILATLFSTTIITSPWLVMTAALTILLPIPTVLAPSSLRVVSRTLSAWEPCQIPSGNLPSGQGESQLYMVNLQGAWAGATATPQNLALETLVGKEILSLPQVCGSDCEYSVSFPSIAFQCQSGVEVPVDMKGTYYQNGETVGTRTFWNATTAQPTSTNVSSTTPFYVYWNSTRSAGSFGQALCTVGRAQYDLTVRFSGGKQSISYNVTHTGDIISQKTKDLSDDQWWEALQLMSLAFSARSWLLGSVSTMIGASEYTGSYYQAITAAAFCNPPPTVDKGGDIVWGDVLEGIEQLSHNISAGVLTMDLGMLNSQCFVSKQEIVYHYDRLNLWLPYGIALFLCFISTVAGTLVFFHLNPENLTASFPDTVSITRNPTLDTFVRGDEADEKKQESSRLRLRLGELRTGRLGLGTPEDMKFD